MSSIRHFTADYIIVPDGEPIRNGLVSVTSDGEIQDVSPSTHASPPNTQRLQGIISPGFVNAHCHLELSHLQGKIPPGTGLVNFIREVIRMRAAEENLISSEIEKADRQMRSNGIVAVGDISNTIFTRKTKLSSSIHYHTFVELLGFQAPRADDIYKAGLKLEEDFLPLSASLVPHAPYSVSRELFRKLQLHGNKTGGMTSMHNQESQDENDFFRYKRGAFLEFYAELGVSTENFRPQARNSIQSILPLFSPKQQILLVHNTFTSLKDVNFAGRFDRNIHWCFCPKANLYIEGKLPRLEAFRQSGMNITLGTDSLASNDKLCILSEMQEIKRHVPGIPSTELINWATLNGAKFLGIANKFGSIAKGKRPGLNLITHTAGLEITADSTVQPLI